MAAMFCFVFLICRAVVTQWRPLHIPVFVAYRRLSRRLGARPGAYKVKPSAQASAPPDLDLQHLEEEEEEDGICDLSSAAPSQLGRATVTQPELYAPQFGEDYDYISSIYYFMWLLMILCARRTRRITFSMNNK